MYHPRINWTPDMDAALNVEGRANYAELARKLQVLLLRSVTHKKIKLSDPARK